MKANATNGPTGPYKGLLLDFGSVIQKSFFETRQEIEQLLELPKGALDWEGPFRPASDALWRKVVAGEFSERDYWNQRARSASSSGKSGRFRISAASTARFHRIGSCVRKCLS
jgi:hypothetical protein